jgi:protein MpaA
VTRFRHDCSYGGGQVKARYKALLVIVLLSQFGCAARDNDDAVAPPAPPPSARVTIASHPPVVQSVTPSAAPASTPPTTVKRTTTFGVSAEGRPLTVTEIGNPASAHRILIVGCIHGDESAGIAIANAITAAAPRVDADFWVIPDLNPDGIDDAQRQNAHGVDLNRNFAFNWTPLGKVGAVNYSGTAATSEPESAAAAALILRIRPTLGIWFHQHLAVVDDSQGPLAVEQRLGQLVGLPLSQLPDYTGSAVGWEDQALGPTAFVVELPAGPVPPATVQRYVDAIDTVSTLLPTPATRSSQSSRPH